MAPDKTDKTDKTPTAPITQRRQVRGLMEYWEAVDSGEEWEFATPSADYFPGMGLGATKEAQKLAWLGLQAEMATATKLALMRPAHRPKKEPFQTMDAYRAFSCWLKCCHLRAMKGQPDAKFTTRELIQAVKRSSKDHSGKGFSHPHPPTIEQSISRGKAILGIDENWNSRVCEELLQTLSQTP